MKLSRMTAVTAAAVLAATGTFAYAEPDTDAAPVSCGASPVSFAGETVSWIQVQSDTGLATTIAAGDQWPAGNLNVTYLGADNQPLGSASLGACYPEKVVEAPATEAPVVTPSDETVPSTYNDVEVGWATAYSDQGENENIVSALVPGAAIPEGTHNIEYYAADGTLIPAPSNAQTSSVDMTEETLPATYGGKDVAYARVEATQGDQSIVAALVPGAPLPAGVTKVTYYDKDGKAIAASEPAAEATEATEDAAADSATPAAEATSAATSAATKAASSKAAKSSGASLAKTGASAALGLGAMGLLGAGAVVLRRRYAH